LPRIVAATPVGKTVKVKLFRNGKEIAVKVKVGKLSGDGRQSHGTTDTEERLGLSLSVLSDEMQERFGLETKEGVLISAVDPDGPASESNLRPGDVIVEANGKDIANLGDLRKLIDSLSPGKVLRILVQRGESSLYTTIKLK